MTDQPKLKVAQVGVAGFGAARRARMRVTGLFDLVASHDWNEAAMTSAQAEDGATPVGSYEELLDYPGIEAMIIATGGKYHAEQVIAAADRGLHVFVEKPLCSSEDEMLAILDAQKRNGVVMACGHNDHSHDRHSVTIKSLLDKGELGDLVAFDSTTCHNGGLMIKPGDWRGDPEKNPGGMLFQCGVHKLHELMYYFGPVKRVSCKMRYDINRNTGTADIALCHLEFVSGLTGCLNAYHVSPYYHTINIFGTRANLFQEHRYFDEGTHLNLQVSHLDGKYEPRVPVDLIGEDDGSGNVRSFYNAIRNGETLYPSVQDGARAVAVVFAAEKSAKQDGATVEVTQI